MREETRKQRKKWLWPVLIFVVVAVIVGAVLAFVLPGNQDPAGAGNTDTRLYWNVDRVAFTTGGLGLSDRVPEEDGMYHIRFAVDGEQIELPVVGDKQLVNYIDSMSIMGLTIDADGVVVDAADAAVVATELARDHFVKKADESKIIINSSKAMNGMEQEITLTEKTAIYNVSAEAEFVGEPGQCKGLDKVSIYADAEGNVTHVFITERAVKAGVYWRVDQQYNSVTAETTRKPDENGVYTMLFAHNGQQVELKCKDRHLVNEIDATNLVWAMFAFRLDEEGYIVESIDVGLALGGVIACNNYNITELDGNAFVAERQLEGANQGSTYSNAYDAECDIFLVEDGCEAAFIGERTDYLKLGDRISCYTDLDGKPILIFVHTRLADSPMYFNAEIVQNRQPDSNGYYVYRMAADGKEVTVRTKDAEIAKKIDSYGGQMMGLKLNGDVVVKVYDPKCICGAWAAGLQRYVTTSTGSVVSLAAPQNLLSATNHLLADNCVVYDVTGYPGVKYGSETTLQLYDRVNAYQNISYNLSHVYVLERYAENAKIYFNKNRLYSAVEKTTVRVPDADGYYVFDMCCEGKEVQVKTKNKEIATFMDKQYAPLVALDVRNGIVTAAYPVAAAVQYGYKELNTNYVGKVEKDGTIHAYYYNGDKRQDRASTFKMAADCKVYNVSTCYVKYQGEPTTLQVDDLIQGIATNPKGEIVQIFVLNRKLESPIYWKTQQKYNSNTGETTRQPDADGWYVFDLAVNGQIKQYRTKDKAVASQVDSFNQAFAMRTNGDEILGAYEAVVAKGIRNYTAGNFDVMDIKGKTATVKRNQPNATNYGQSYDITFAKEYKVYDVSSYAESFGAPATLEVGDRITCLINEQSEVVYCFIVYKNTRQAGPVGLCSHCNKEVFWEPFNGWVYSSDIHFYLTHDVTRPSQLTIGSSNEEAERVNVVLDLNGKTITAEKRGVLVYGDLSVMDSVGGGKVVSVNKDGSHGGVAMVLGSGSLSVYGGTLTQSAEAPMAQYGGVLYITNKATLNVYGGTITGGKASSGSNIYLTDQCNVNFAGGKIDGGVYVATKGTVTLSGAPQLSGIHLAAGLKLTLGEMKKDAKILVTADGAFTKPSEKAADYAKYFAAESAKDTIEVQDNALVYVKTPVDIGDIDNGDLSIDPNAPTALCPVCDREVVWTPATNQKSIYPGSGAHYYLAEDIVFDGTADAYFLSPSSGEACLHLNGHSITATAQRAVTAVGGTLNIIGNGTVSGNFAKAWYGGATAHAYGNGVLNLWGGTYVKPLTNTTENPILYVSSGTVNMYTGATVDGTGITATKTAACVMLENDNALFYMHGGEIKNGMALVGGGNVRQVYGRAVIAGGKITGGDVYISQTQSLALTGAPEIELLTLPEGVTMYVVDMEQGASVTISADGVFTEPYEQMADYKDYFRPVRLDIEIQEKDNTLVCVKPRVPSGIDNSDLVFEEGTTNAQCPACRKKVSWEAISGELTETKWLQAGGHYYLSDDVTYSGTGEAIYSPVGMVSRTACLHLNGHNITASAGKAIHCGDGTLNVMGNGTVSGGNATTYGGATIHTWGNGKLYLYGGTYTKGASTYPVIFVGAQTVNLYDGVVLEGQGTIPGYYALMYLENNNATVNMYGGIIQNGKATGTCGNVKAYQGTFNMLGGIIQNGEGSKVGNVHMCNTGKCNLSGGEIKNGGTYIEVDGALTLSYAPVIEELILPAGVKAIVGDLEKEADIKIEAEGAFTVAKEGIAELKDCFKPVRDDAEVLVEENVLICKTIQLPENNGNDALVFVEGTTNAICPVCEELVKWTGLEGDIAAAFWLQDGGHYYLSGDINSTAIDGAITVNTTTGNAACLHLNGHSITSTADCAINSYGTAVGALNIMGNGTVSGAGVSASEKWRAATLNVTNGAEVNLYGGTFTKGASNAPVVWVWAGSVNLYDGAKLVGTDQNLSTYSSTVYLQNEGANFYMHGGEITGGTNLNSGGNVLVNNGAFVMDGGTIRDGNANAYFGGNVYVKGGAFTLNGGTISGGTAVYHGSNIYVNTGSTVSITGGTITNGNLYVAASDTTTLSGAPVIAEMKLPSGVKVTLDGLTAGADIAVNATAGVFTNTGVSGSLGRFRALNGTDSIVAQADGSLAYLSNAKLSLDASGNAVCPVCCTSVKWTALSGNMTNSFWMNTAGNHYYLNGDMTSSGSDGAIAVNVAAGSSVCLHLNGYNLNSTVDTAVRYYKDGTLNIMGNGTVSGAGVSASDKWRAATLNITGGAKLNLYGGTFTKGASNAPVVWVWAGDVNLYGGAKLVGTDQNLSTYSSTVYLHNAEANFHMYGGEITDGTNLNSGGNVNINNGAFVMDGGKIHGGAANGYHGGNVYLKAGSFTMNGGTVSGGTAVWHGSNIYVNSGSTATISGGKITNGNLYVSASGTTTLSGAPVIAEMKLPSGVKVTLDNLTKGADVTVNAEGVFAEANTNAAEYLSYFKAYLPEKIVKQENDQLMIG